MEPTLVQSSRLSLVRILKGVLYAISFFVILFGFIPDGSGTATYMHLPFLGSVGYALVVFSLIGSVVAHVVLGLRSIRSLHVVLLSARVAGILLFAYSVSSHLT